jgi:hypothetical protein
MKGPALAFGLAALLLPAAALAQEQPPPPPFLPRVVTWSWDKTSLRLSVSYREIIDETIRQRLTSGIPTLLVFNGLLFEKGSSTPVPGALLLKSCRVVYDVWDEVYAVEVIQNQGSSYSPAVATLEGVLRKCAQFDRTPLIERSRLKQDATYELKAIIEINPISPEVIARIKRWVSRPKGSATVGAGDALFGSFVGLFVAQIGNADREFRFYSSPPLQVPPPPPPPPPPKKK